MDGLTLFISMSFLRQKYHQLTLEEDFILQIHDEFYPFEMDW